MPNTSLREAVLRPNSTRCCTSLRDAALRHTSTALSTRSSVTTPTAELQAGVTLSLPFGRLCYHANGNATSLREAAPTAALSTSQYSAQCQCPMPNAQLEWR